MRFITTSITPPSTKSQTICVIFHAQWRRENPTTPGKNYTILDTQGEGHFVGVALFMQARKPHDIGFLEGDEMVYVDGADKPCINGTGTEDYFCSGWYFDPRFPCNAPPSTAA